MDLKSLGKRIREERLKLNLTQEKLSEQIGISVSYIGQIERGERSPTLQTLVLLANELGVTIDYLLQDSVVIEDENYLKMFAQAISGRSAKEKQMALDIIKLLFSHLDKK